MSGLAGGKTLGKCHVACEEMKAALNTRRRPDPVLPDDTVAHEQFMHVGDQRRVWSDRAGLDATRWWSMVDDPVMVLLDPL